MARLQGAIKAAKSARTLPEAQAEAKAARVAAEAAEAELAAQQKELGGPGGGGAMSAADETKVRKEYIRLRKVYLDRRRTCMEVVGELGEGTGKSDKKLIEEIGLETDEEYGVQRTAFPPLH